MRKTNWIICSHLGRISHLGVVASWAASGRSFKILTFVFVSYLKDGTSIIIIINKSTVPRHVPNVNIVIKYAYSNSLLNKLSHWSLMPKLWSPENVTVRCLRIHTLLKVAGLIIGIDAYMSKNDCVKIWGKSNNI